MLIEFIRAMHRDEQLGEDDGLGQQHKISVNPVLIAAVFEATNAANVTIIKFADGRGMLVKGSYAETMERLSGGGRVATQQTGEQEGLH